MHPEICIYSVKMCSGCEQLKTLLRERNVPFKEFDMSTPEGLTELFFNQCFTFQAPVLQADSTFYLYTQIFQENEISDTIKRLITL